ncbi:MAG: DNA mismatch repair endonuclease MutL [Candidatus Gastranaerophilales bacterium]|nr:DNA mismatch repair endonuclease MutL [Candidatus Gastranaerophilales bacterium]
MKRIQQLPKNVINQIAAGEVIERPASVVKELTENSIDAGATKISIEISNECRDIRIADNGSGIHPDDIVLAFSKHATSKIQTGEDLYDIHTLGFRGEALASIISIAKVTCTTRTKDYDYGTKVVCENSEIEYSKTGCAVGTIMQITELFYNLPVRLKFLKTEKTELAYITELVTSIALSNPDISIELKNNNKTVLKTDGIDGVEGIIKNLFSKDTFSHLKSVSNDDKLVKIEINGYVSTPDYTRSSKKDYHIFVNNRTVKCPVFIKAIDIAYKNSLPNGKYPFIVLNLNIPASDIDINVHPAKREVKYKNPNQIFNFIRFSIEQALSNYGHNSANFEQAENVISFTKNIPEKRSFEEGEVFVPETAINVNKILQVIESSQQSANQHEPVSVKHDYIRPAVLQQQIVDKNVVKSNDNIIGQYHNTYILIEVEDGLEIVDQHIADERYIYETLKNQHEPASQLLFISDVIDIDIKDGEIIKDNLDKFTKFGYEIEFLKDTEIIFRKIPLLLSKYNPKDILSDIMENIEGDINNFEEKILITTSCKAAVKANTPLNLFQMEEIISRWRKCENPYTCPHGRPISKVFKHKEIAGFFMRMS